MPSDFLVYKLQFRDHNRHGLNRHPCTEVYQRLDLHHLSIINAHSTALCMKPFVN